MEEIPRPAQSARTAPLKPMSHEQKRKRFSIKERKIDPRTWEVDPRRVIEDMKGD